MFHASLFSGIGGFDLAAERAGWANVFNCEIDQFCQKVLKYHFPNAIQYKDIKSTDFTDWRGKVDIITGGFPCQPFSMAGKRRGTDDDRHLWPEMLRAIREIRPTWIVGENVYGFTNWSGGLVFNQVLSDLENEGYEVQPFIIPACAVNAPHRRDRVWIVAHATNADRHRQEKHSTKTREQTFNGIGGLCQNGDAADALQQGYPVRFRPGRRSIHNQTEQSQRCELTRTYSKENWSQFPTQSPLCSRNDGFPSGLDGITVSKLRNESIKAAGNAIVPNVAFEIFKAIEQYEMLNAD